MAVKLILSKGPDIKPVTVLPFVGMSIDSVLSQLDDLKVQLKDAQAEAEQAKQNLLREWFSWWTAPRTFPAWHTA